nr:hypothetical protein [Trochiscia hystrix]
MSDDNMTIKLNGIQVTWNDINWGKTYKNVRRIQFRIYKAKINGYDEQVHWLQNHLIKSKAAKLVAVRQVTTLNKGKKTAGVDKQIITKPEDKLQLALSLNLDGKALPICRVWIPKPGKTEMRPLGIPSIRDRAKQALAKLALEPEWEAIFEPNSYGFRPGRSAHDAIEAIFLNLSHNTPKLVYDADIRKCFDQIDHQVLLEKLNTFPLMKRQVEAWLKAGIMEGYANTPKETTLYPSWKGTPQGGIISPLLANIALHGLENHLKDFVALLPIKPHEGANRGYTPKRKALSVIRYADDFVLIHRNKVILDLCIEETRKWLASVGLEISAVKSALRDGRNGFVFLGFQIIQVRKIKVDVYKTKIQPSRESQLRLLRKVREIIINNRSSSSYLLITKLRPVIIGWANYFKYCECKAVFSKLTHLIFQKLRAWAFRRDTRNGRLTVKQRYFPSGRSYKYDGSIHQDNWVLVGRQKNKKGIIREVYLPHMVWVKSRKYVKVKEDQTPFNLSIYWAMRSAKHSPYPLRVRNLLKRQNQRCPICKRIFTELDSTTWEVDHITPRSQGGKDEYKNLQLLHKNCHLQKTRKGI